jgi:acyl carrier protein
MNENSLNKLQKVFRHVFQNPELQIHAGTTADDISMWDSLTHMELIASIENEFSVTFSLNEVLSFKCVGDMLSTIDNKTGES